MAAHNKTVVAIRPEENEEVQAKDKSESFLAAELKRQRTLQNYSLEQLANLSGVSRSMISKIERGAATPTTTVLSRLAEALGVTFGRLMAETVQREIVVIPAARQPVLRDAETGYTRRCISPVLPGRGVDWLLNTLPPGGSTGEFMPHRRGVEEYLFVLKGRISVGMGAKSVTLEEGDALFFEADVIHTFKNMTNKPCEYFIIIDSAKVR